MRKISLIDWQPGLSSPTLGNVEVHLWRIDLSDSHEDLTLLMDVLSFDEKERAGRFVFSRDRDRFVVCRAALRKILAGYLDVPARDVRFANERFGKPRLLSDEDLRFNVSHSRNLGLIAVSRGREIGIDVEYVDADFDCSSTAASVLLPEDLDRIKGMAGTEQANIFFSGWTRKEAFLKAMGDGLSSSDELQEAAITFGEDGGVYRYATGTGIRDWSMVTFDIEREFKAALVVEGDEYSIRLMRFRDRVGAATDSVYCPAAGLDLEGITCAE